MKHYMVQKHALATIEKTEISEDAYCKCIKMFKRHKKTLIRHNGKLYKMCGSESRYFYETEHNIVVDFIAHDIIDI